MSSYSPSNPTTNLLETITNARKWLFEERVEPFKDSENAWIRENDEFVRIAFPKKSPYKDWYNHCFCDPPYTDWLKQFGQSDYLRITGDIEQVFGKRKLLLYSKRHRAKVCQEEIVDVVKIASLLPGECLIAHNQPGAGASEPRHVHFHLYAGGMRQFQSNGKSKDLINWLIENVQFDVDLDGNKTIDGTLKLQVKVVKSPFTGISIIRTTPAVHGVGDEHFGSLIFQLADLCPCNLIFDSQVGALQVFVIPRSKDKPDKWDSNFGWLEMFGFMTISASETDLKNESFCSKNNFMNKNVSNLKKAVEMVGLPKNGSSSKNEGVLSWKKFLEEANKIIVRETKV